MKKVGEPSRGQGDRFKDIMRPIFVLVGLIKVLIGNILHGIGSAGVWAFMWLLAFLVSTVLLANLSPTPDAVVTVTALSLTFAVVSGHTSKLFSYLVGCDTDYRHVFARDERRMRQKPNLFRFFASLAFLGTAVVRILYHIKEANTASNVTDILDFTSYSWNFAEVILFIFLAQVVFSWPDPAGKTAVKIDEPD